MSEGVVIHDASGAIKAANPSAEAILGLSLDQMTGRLAVDPRWRLIRPDGQPATAADIPSEITQRTGEPCRNVMLGVHRASGEIAWLSINTDLVLDEGTGRPRFVVATFTNITEEVLAKRELERSRAHLARLIDVSPGVTYQYLLRPDGTDAFPFVSARGTEVLGVDGAELMSDPVRAWARTHPEDLGPMRAAITQSAATLSPFEQEFRVPEPSGQGWRWLRAHSVPERTAEGILWTGIILDVTRERQFAERLRRAARREAMGDLAASVAHNFNNMLASIIPNLELAREGAAPAVLPSVEDALQAALSAGELVRQLMAFARSEPTEAPAHAVEFGALAHETLRLCRRAFDPTTELRDRITTEPLPVWALASHLHQVVMNLCINARDATAGRPSPWVEVELEASAAADGSRWAVLRVTDNGVGMSPETMRRLGEPFFTTKGPGHGTGLGLASVYGIVRDAGGTITCDSHPDRGTRFEVRLPIRDGAASHDGAAVGAPARSRREGRRVLIVDDDRLVRIALGRQLEHVGYHVDEADGGRAALSLIDRGPLPSVIIMDMSMPDLAGPELLRAFRERAPDVPVVVLSGLMPSSEGLEWAARLLQKPISGADLTGVLDEVIARAEG
jgi:PAS domain S-box-containing protein